jgi:hypothetical protein
MKEKGTTEYPSRGSPPHARTLRAKGLGPPAPDDQATLTRVARLAIPSLADYCIVDAVDERGKRRAVQAAHVDPEK